ITAPTVTSKVYDGTTDATSCVTKGTVSGIFAMDSGVSVAIATATFNTADAWNDKIIAVTYSMTGDNNNNYIKPVDSTITSATITPATITYNAVGYSNIYDGSAHGITVNNITTKGSQSATITYCSTSNGTYNATELKYSDCVTQKVYFKITAPNHNEITDSATVTIAKATYDMSGVSFVDASKVYNGEV
ncbi:MAG: YDG domain-containing protein, partial [Clostridia bacterium]